MFEASSDRKDRIRATWQQTIEANLESVRAESIEAFVQSTLSSLKNVLELLKQSKTHFWPSLIFSNYILFGQNDLKLHSQKCSTKDWHRAPGVWLVKGQVEKANNLANPCATGLRILLCRNSRDISEREYIYTYLHPDIQFQCLLTLWMGYKMHVKVPSSKNAAASPRMKDRANGRRLMTCDLCFQHFPTLSCQAWDAQSEWHRGWLAMLFRSF